MLFHSSCRPLIGIALIVVLAFAGCSASTGSSDPGSAGTGGLRYYVAGSYSNGLFRSSDDGATWTPCDSGVQNLGHKWISAMTATSKGTLIAGSLGSGLLRSTDTGKSWKQANSSFQPSSVYVLYNYGSSIYVSTTPNEVSRSTDDGLTWVSANSNLPTYGTWNAFLMTPNIMIAGSYDMGLWRSTNNGTSWTTADTGLNKSTDDKIMALVDAGNSIIAGTYSDGMYRSTNNGMSWSPIPGAPKYVRSLAHIGNSLFAGYGGGLSQSTDNGATWIARLTLPSVTIDYTQNVDAFAGSGNTILAGTDGSGIARSTDGGVTWNFIKQGISAPQIWTLVSLP